MKSYYQKDDVFMKIDSVKRTMEIRIKNESLNGTFRNSGLFAAFVDGVDAAVNISDTNMQELQIGFYRTKNDYCRGTITNLFKLRAFHKNVLEIMEVWNKFNKIKGIA